LAVALHAPAAVAVERHIAPVAHVEIGSSGISWQPQVDNQGTVVTISGGDQYVTLRFEAGQRPSFSGLDNEGRLLPDGTYTWELAMIARPIEPDSGAASQGAPDHNGRTGQQTASAEIPRLSGSFTILAGSFVDGDKVEAAASPDDD
jgi:hypothetical protein